jgi:hypothetical protein
LTGIRGRPHAHETGLVFLELPGAVLRAPGLPDRWHAIIRVVEGQDGSGARAAAIAAGGNIALVIDETQVCRVGAVRLDGGDDRAADRDDDNARSAHDTEGRNGATAVVAVFQPLDALIQE